MNEIQEVITTANKLKAEGEKELALDCFSQAFNLLIDQAGVYARAQEPDITDMDELRAIAPTLLEHSRVFLRQNLTAASLLNEMGVLFAELGEYDNARQKFQEALDLSPEGVQYDQPMINLQNIPDSAIDTTSIDAIEE